MPSTDLHRISRLVSTSVAVTLAAVLALPVGASTQDASPAIGSDFLAAVEEARDDGQRTIDEAIGAIDSGCIGLEVKDCLQRFVAVQLPKVAAQYTAYADRLESLEVPEPLAGDVSEHAEALRQVAALLHELVTAAEAGEVEAVRPLTDEVAAIHADLASRLDPRYARAAFVSPFVGLPLTPFARTDFLGLLGGSTPEEVAYLDEVRQAQREVLTRDACFGGALQRPSDTNAARLAALVACGAGRTYPTIQARARALEPPERFADEHAWWLAGLEEAVRHDRLMAEAADADDLTTFLAHAIRLGLVFRPYEGLDPGFGAVLPPPGSPMGTKLDLGEAIARTSYGQALFAALVDYWIADPRFHSTWFLEFGQLPATDRLGAITAAAEDLRETAGELQGAIEALEPPAEVAEDHQLILGFVARESDRLEERIAAAAGNDLDAALGPGEPARADFCSTSEQLSDAIRPVAEAYFEAGPMCG